MSDAIKIMVRTTELREISIEIRFMILLSNIGPDELDAKTWVCACGTLNTMGYISNSMRFDENRGKWVANFQTIRNATDDEVDAWHTMKKTKKLISCMLCDSYKREQGLASKFLDDKEIIIEVVRDDAHDN